MAESKRHLIIYTDGGSRGNPGHSGCGIFITDREWYTIEKRFKYIWIATNNIAEYTAALLGVRRAIELGANSIELRADSKLVIEQLLWNYKVKNPELKKIFLELQNIVGEWWWDIVFTHIFREQNSEADRLSNVAMDKKW
jgi:ribonuclease HI